MIFKVKERKKTSIEHLDPNLPPLIANLYATRGMQTDQNILSLNKMLPPNLKNIELAADIISNAIIDNKKIIIIGDFDADGATSTALSILLLRRMYANNLTYLIPNRFDYGYGLSPEIVDLAHQNGANLIITVDNGISSNSGVDHACELGIDVVITDHHLPGTSLPNASAIVNPNLNDCSFASKNLAGVGVAFYIMAKIRQVLDKKNWFKDRLKPKLSDFLDIVALGTIADVVPLDYNNRILVSQGLKIVQQGKTRPGILAILEVANIDNKDIEASDFGYSVAPRLNAAGRLEDMSLGVELLLTEDYDKAIQLAHKLDSLNKQRKLVEEKMQQDAQVALATINLSELPPAIALYNDTWHQGVIGILASRIKERYYRPTIIFTKDKGTSIKGSARSIPELHMRDLLENINNSHPGIINKFGGHAMAAGLVIDEANFPLFKKCYHDAVVKALDATQLIGQLITDGELSCDLISLQSANLIKIYGPWGQNFAEPLFNNKFKLLSQKLVKDSHLQCELMLDNLVVRGIAFNVDTTIWPDANITDVDVVYSLKSDTFRNTQRLNLIIKQIEPA